MEQTKLSNPITMNTNTITMTTTALKSKSDLVATKIEYRELLPSPTPSLSTPSLSSSPSTSKDAGEEVRVIGMKEYKGAAECLAQAFAFDEVARYLVDTDDLKEYGEEYKMKLHTEILEYVTAAHVLKGVVTTVGGDYGAVALWMPPGKENDDWLTIFRSGMWRLFYKLSREGKTRFYKEFLPLLHRTAHEVMHNHGGDAWYLVYLGTKPGARGKGYAGKLIEHGIGLAAKTNHPIYLESSAAVNVPYYEKFGFSVVKDVYLQRAKKPVALTIMVRGAGRRGLGKLVGRKGELEGK